MCTKKPLEFTAVLFLMVRGLKLKLFHRADAIELGALHFTFWLFAQKLKIQPVQLPAFSVTETPPTRRKQAARTAVRILVWGSLGFDIPTCMLACSSDCSYSAPPGYLDNHDHLVHCLNVLTKCCVCKLFVFYRYKNGIENRCL